MRCERLGEQVGAHAVGVAGDGHHAQPGRARRDDRAQVRGRLDQHGVARRWPGRGTPSTARADRPSRRPRRARAGCRRPRARTRRAAPRALRRGRAPRRPGAARRGPGRRRPRRSAAGRATGSRWRAGSRRAAGRPAAPAGRRALDGARAEGDRLPGEVRGRLRLRTRRRRRCPRPGRGSRTPSAASAAIARCTVTGEARWRAMSSRTDGRRSPGRARVGAGAQVLDDACLCVIVEHEWRG